MKRLTQTQQYTLINALTAAADIAARDAQTMDTDGIRGLAERFRQQQRECLALRDQIEDSDALALLRDDD
jgi:hypothetical protein